MQLFKLGFTQLQNQELSTQTHFKMHHSSSASYININYDLSGCSKQGNHFVQTETKTQNVSNSFQPFQFVGSIRDWMVVSSPIRKVPQRSLVMPVMGHRIAILKNEPHAQIKRWQASLWSCKSPGRCQRGLAAAIVFSVMYFLNRHTFVDEIAFYGRGR